MASFGLIWAKGQFYLFRILVGCRTMVLMNRNSGKIWTATMIWVLLGTKWLLKE